MQSQTASKEIGYATPCLFGKWSMSVNKDFNYMIGQRFEDSLPGYKNIIFNSFP
jgi:hypothetical protein